MLFKYRFSLKKPIGDRRTFDIVCDKKSNVVRSQQSIKKHKDFTAEANTLAVVNHALLDGKLQEYQAKAQCELIIKGLKERVNTVKDAQRSVVISEGNMKLFEDFWRDRYSDRRLKDTDRSYNTFLYAIKILEPHGLLSADKETLRKHFSKKLTGNAHRRYVTYLNTLLRYYNRGFHLSVQKSQLKQIDFIEYEKFKKLLPKCTDEKLKLLIATLYATGCRTGEAFDLTKRSLKRDMCVHISHQVRRDGTRDDIKNGRPHDAVIIAEFLPELKLWMDTPLEEKLTIRNTCAHAIPDFFREHGYNITAHELRHSYVNYLAERGVTIDDLADCLGDTHEVVKKHYQGWIIGDKRMANLFERVNH